MSAVMSHPFLLTNGAKRIDLYCRWELLAFYSKFGFKHVL